MNFQTNLIIEVTSACNRSCSGCYAPNVVSSASARELMNEKPNLFLDVKAVESLVMFWDQDLPKTVSIRGGEPSLHPKLPDIFLALKFFAGEIVLETHGRWLLMEQRSEYESLIQAIVASNIIVKISFDSMHGLKPHQLREMTEFLETMGVSYLIAITEKDAEAYERSKSQVSWIKEEKFIFQVKAFNSESLIKPRFGVLNSRGLLVGGLNSKFSETPNLKEAIG